MRRFNVSARREFSQWCGVEGLRLERSYSGGFGLGGLWATHTVSKRPRTQAKALSAI